MAGEFGSSLGRDVVGRRGEFLPPSLAPSAFLFGGAGERVGQGARRRARIDAGDALRQDGTFAVPETLRRMTTDDIVSPGTLPSARVENVPSTYDQQLRRPATTANEAFVPPLPRKGELVVFWRQDFLAGRDMDSPGYLLPTGVSVMAGAPGFVTSAGRFISPPALPATNVQAVNLQLAYEFGQRYVQLIAATAAAATPAAKNKIWADYRDELLTVYSPQKIWYDRFALLGSVVAHPTLTAMEGTHTQSTDAADRLLYTICAAGGQVDVQDLNGMRGTRKHGLVALSFKYVPLPADMTYVLAGADKDVAASVRDGQQLVFQPFAQMRELVGHTIYVPQLGAVSWPTGTAIPNEHKRYTIELPTFETAPIQCFNGLLLPYGRVAQQQRPLLSARLAGVADIATGPLPAEVKPAANCRAAAGGQPLSIFYLAAPMTPI